MGNDIRSRFSRVLLTRMKYIGDVVLTTPLIRSLRSALPGAHLAYMADRHAASLLAGNPFLDEIIPYDFSAPAVREQTRVGLGLRRGRFDLVLDLFSNPRSAQLSWLSGAPVRVGLDRGGRRWLYTLRVQDDGRPKTAVEFHNQFLRAVGIEPVSVRPELYLLEEERAEIAPRLVEEIFPRADSPAGPLIALHAGATWPAKQWGTSQFAHLAQLLRARLSARVVITGGPADALTLADVVRSAAGSARPAGTLPLRRLAALLAVCDVAVCNDGGPMHIAAALGTPTIGLFGPGEEQIWFPYDRADGHRALRKHVPCHPCHLDVCTRQGEEKMECMKLLTVYDVFSAVEAALSRGARTEHGRPAR